MIGTTIKYTFAILLSLGTSVYSQPNKYSSLNAHSHNDYRNTVPFYTAYHQGFGSIEVDIFPVGGNLLVAHDKSEIDPESSLYELYLKPISTELAKNPRRKLRLLIDIKENHPEALLLLIKQLEPLNKFLSTTKATRQLSIVISGNRPKASDFYKYPDYIFFDHDLSGILSAEQIKRVGLISVPFTKYTRWNGIGELTPADKKRVVEIIDSAHQLKKQIRFWAAPDTRTAWQTQINMGVDVIGTDKIKELGIFLEGMDKRNYGQQKSKMNN